MNRCAFVTASSPRSPRRSLRTASSEDSALAESRCAINAHDERPGVQRG